MTKRAPVRCGWGLLAALVAAAPGNAAGLLSPGCLAGGDTTTAAAVDDRLDIHLGDGRIVHLPGIAVPDAMGETRALLQAWLAQKSILVRPIRSGLDRWGRTEALVFAPGAAEGAASVSVTEALLDAGRVLARPDLDLDACWPVYLALEGGARQDRRGLWAATPVIDPADAAKLAAQEGTMAIVAGRIAAAHTGRTRVYLRFAQDGGTGMAATVGLPLVRRMAKDGSDPRDWAGRRLRVRGLLARRWGWQIEVTNPAQLEIDPP